MIDFNSLILPFLEKAGAMALETQGKVKHDFKGKDQIVTETDLAISKMFQDLFKDHVDQGQVTIIDEELQLDKASVVANAKSCPYVVIIDPIDGTRPYFNGLPFWGIGIAVFHNSKPIWSTIYLPKLKQLFLFDGDPKYIESPFRSEEKTEILKPVTITNIDQTFICAQVGSHLKIDEYRFLDIFCAMYFNAITMLGQAAGAMYRAPHSIWDVAPIVPFLKPLGLECRSVTTNHIFEDLNFDFVEDSLKMSGLFIISRPDLFETIKKMIK